MSVVIKYGDLVLMAKRREVNVLVHGCNCFHKMGAGIAKQIAKELPFAYQADLKTPYGDKSKLGTHSAATQDGLTVVNAYTQYRYGRGLQVDYDAVASVMKAVARDFSNEEFCIGMPQIGAGLAGGDWSKINRIIEEAFEGMEITVVIYSR